MSLFLSTACSAQALRSWSAARVSSPPAIDGRLNDACWTGIEHTSGFSIYSDPQTPHPEPTSARICFDDDYLYVAIEGSVADPSRYRQAVTDGAGKFEYYRGGGTVELFVDPQGAGQSFQQFLMHVTGTSQAAAPSGDFLSVLNLSYVNFRTALTDSGFVIEAALPLAMLHPRADAPQWGFNITRCHELYLESLEPDRMYSAWNSTQGRPFPDTKGFGVLTIDADLSPFSIEVTMPREPRIGDSAVEIVVLNSTGQSLEGVVTLDVTGDVDQPIQIDEPLWLQDGESRRITLRYAVTPGNVSAEYRFTIKDASGRIRWLGGTQKIDLTSGDPWSVPVADTKSQQRGYQIFRRPSIQPVLYRSVPRQEELVEKLEMIAAPGQWESGTVSFHPLRDLQFTSVRVSDLVSNSGAIPASSLELRQVTYQSVWKDMRQFESIEHLLRRFDALKLAAGCSQRVELIVHVPQESPPGMYCGTIEFAGNDGTCSIPVELRVLPFELAPADDIAYFMYFPGVPSGAYGDKAFFDKIVADMRDHGMTTMTLYHSCQTTDGQGKEVIDVDGLVDPKFGVTYAEMIESIAISGLGKHAPLIDVSAMHLVREPRLLAQLQGIYQKRNWPNVGFYIEDEIDFPDRIERARIALSGLKENAPDALTATAMGFKGAEALGHLYDIWIGCSWPELREKCLAMGKQPWTYSCRPLNEISPAFVRYFYGQFVWNTGLRGIGLWSYAEDDKFTDRFGRTYPYCRDLTFQPEWKQEYGHVVFEGDEIVPTITWEAARQGINDYRYLITLAQEIEHASKGSAAAARGRELLQSIREQFNPEIGIMDLKYGRDWQAVGDLSEIRRRVIDAILAIHAEQHD